jgi:hypothetical protein
MSDALNLVNQQPTLLLAKVRDMGCGGKQLFFLGGGGHHGKCQVKTRSTSSTNTQRCCWQRCRIGQARAHVSLVSFLGGGVQFNRHCCFRVH